ncbi:MAG: cation diffusion facilitator family transporter [Acidobacteriota bacterium]|nr:cation diffusion facilitator family transporter [Acidobacteriota bacterium]
MTASRLRVALLLTLAYIVLLVVAGAKAHSLALLSEAGHNASDFLALLLSWVAAYLSERPATATKTYGWRRAGVLTAFMNAAGLILVALAIFYSAFVRFRHPEAVEAGLMMWVSAAGVVLNGAITLMLLKGSHDLNVRSVLVHEIGDTLSTAMVIVGGWLILRTGQQWIDPALSVLISALVLWSSVSIVRESLNILLEGLPEGMDLATVDADLRRVPGVLDLHDLHIWSIGSDTHALSSHVTIDDIPPSASAAILEALRAMLAERHGIRHTTIQFESAENCELSNGCTCAQPANEHYHHHPEELPH